MALGVFILKTSNPNQLSPRDTLQGWRLNLENLADYHLTETASTSTVPGL